MSALGDIVLATVLSLPRGRNTKPSREEIQANRMKAVKLLAAKDMMLYDWHVTYRCSDGVKSARIGGLSYYDMMASLPLGSRKVKIKKQVYVGVKPDIYE